MYLLKWNVQFKTLFSSSIWTRSNRRVRKRAFKPIKKQRRSKMLFKRRGLVCRFSRISIKELLAQMYNLKLLTVDLIVMSIAMLEKDLARMRNYVPRSKASQVCCQKPRLYSILTIKIKVQGRYKQSYTWSNTSLNLRKRFLTNLFETIAKYLLQWGELQMMQTKM